MTDTVNNQIPFVPENTIDPAAGLNLSLNTVDALLQVLVQTVGANTPPGSPVNGARYIVGTAPTGAWASQANKLARRLDGAWQFFDARHVLNSADGLWYVRSASTWSALAGSAPAWGSITGTLSAQTDLQVALAGKAGTGDSRLTDAREWSAETVMQAEAEAGTATTRRAWTALRVRQAVAAWWGGVSTAFGRSLVGAADAPAGRTALLLGSAATRTALGTTGALYSRDSILGTVSQSSGVPTGALFERGINANGRYERLASGTQECISVVFSGTLMAGQAVGIDAPFAAAFAATPDVAVLNYTQSGVEENPTFIQAGIRNAPGVSSCRAVVRNSHPTLTLAYNVSVVANGRWF